MNLAHLDLRKVKLDDANLRRADLSYARLAQALVVWTQPGIQGNLRRADLTDAKLVGAKAGGAWFTDAILVGADLHDAYLNTAQFGGADGFDPFLTGAKEDN